VTYTVGKRVFAFVCLVFVCLSVCLCVYLFMQLYVVMLVCLRPSRCLTHSGLLCVCVCVCVYGSLSLYHPAHTHNDPTVLPYNSSPGGSLAKTQPYNYSNTHTCMHNYSNTHTCMHISTWRWTQLIYNYSRPKAWWYLAFLAYQHWPTTFTSKNIWVYLSENLDNHEFV